MTGLQRGGRSATPARPDDRPPPDAATLAASFAQKLWRFTTNPRRPHADGTVLAPWWLLTNVPAEWGGAGEVARW